MNATKPGSLVPVPVPAPVSSPPVVFKGSKRRMSPEALAKARLDGLRTGGQSAGNRKKGKARHELPPEHYAALTAARKAAAAAKRHALEVEVPALRARVAELEAELARLRGKR